MGGFCILAKSVTYFCVIGAFFEGITYLIFNVVSNGN